MIAFVRRFCAYNANLKVPHSYEEEFCPDILPLNLKAEARTTPAIVTNVITNNNKHFIPRPSTANFSEIDNSERRCGRP